MGRALKEMRSRLLRAAALAFLAVVLGPAAAAMALPPTLEIESPVTGSVSSNRTPFISGHAEEGAGEVTLVIDALSGGGPPVQTFTTSVVSGIWVVVPLEPLLDGTYTALATQTNPAAETDTSAPVTFTVDTKPPVVTLTGPPSPSNNTKPSFTGSASDTTPVTVKIYKGGSVKGSFVSSATAGGTGGGWASGEASPELGNGKYTAIATEESSLGNPAGKSEPVTFWVDTEAPAVTLNPPPSPSSDATPSFTGTAEETTPVTVDIYAGASASGPPVSTATAEGKGGGWSSGNASPALPIGQYTAVAVQESSPPGHPGGSAPVSFGVVAPVSFGVVAPSISAPVPPGASFKWFPSEPQTGEPVSLVSSSTDPASAITAFAWAPTTGGPFQAGGPVFTTRFSTPGAHLVRLLVTNAYGLSSVAGGTIVVVSPTTPLMQPFPVVRIAGTETSSGIRLRLLAVQQAPAGSRITVRCKGRGCPVKSASRVAAAGRVGLAPVEFRRFERTLRPGVTLEVRIAKAGVIGKYTRLVVRRGKLPERVDTCLAPAGVRPMACPSS
jgi:hypothetical protein